MIDLLMILIALLIVIVTVLFYRVKELEKDVQALQRKTGYIF